VGKLTERALHFEHRVNACARPLRGLARERGERGRGLFPSTSARRQRSWSNAVGTNRSPAWRGASTGNHKLVKPSPHVGLALTFTVTMLGLSGCNWLGGRHDDENMAPIVIDEQTGSYGDVHFGSSDAEVRAAFGEPSDEDGFFPLNADSYTGPVFIRSPGGRKPLLLKYEDVAFLVAPGYGVFAIAVTQPDVSTTRVVEIGDPLQDVRTNYEDVGCGEAVAGEGLFGGDPSTYPWCRARLASVDVFFGGNPIESVTLTPGRLSGGSSP
jgi:hypothetical protein